MYAVALANFKGGTGKSTTAIHLAVAAAQAHMNVALIDADEQRSVTSWASLRDEQIPLVVETEARHLPDIMRQLRRRMDLCLIDCPGHDWRSLGIAVASVDLTIVVSKPTLLDVDVSTRVRNLLLDHDLPHAFLLSQVPPQHGSRLAEWASAYSELGSVVSPPISNRVGYQDLVKCGLGVTEYAPYSKAAGEIEGVLHWILRRGRRRL